jgi:hypothetical protein
MLRDVDGARGMESVLDDTGGFEVGFFDQSRFKEPILELVAFCEQKEGERSTVAPAIFCCLEVMWVLIHFRGEKVLVRHGKQRDLP